MSSSRASPTRPLRWLREAEAEEVALSLWTIDPEKAIEVALCLVRQAGPEIAGRLQEAMAVAKTDTPRALLRVGLSVLRGVAGR